MSKPGKELVFDAWTTLTFKQHFGPRRVPGMSYAAPSWVGGEHMRRLLAYVVLQAYIDNAAREFLTVREEKDRAEHREYGDAALFRNSALSALLGEEQSITVDGAADDPDEAEGADNTAIERARAQQDWLEQWADDERFLVKLQECEQNSVGLGDGVYVLGWSSKKGRPRLRIFDPGFYFPVLHDGNEDEYPERVHIAWELPPDEREPGKVKVRRMTWELVDLVDDAGNPAVARVPYQDEPVTKTCLLTDATWTLDRAARHVDDLTAGTAEYATNEDGDEVRELDLSIDYIPVVHISNTVAVGNHYGRSALAYIAQLLDDVANVDTDLSAAAATTGTPPIALSGASASGQSTLTYKPGTVFTVGDGKMDVLDTSRSLDALLKYLDQLLSRLSVNGRMPAALLGRVDPSEVPSGIALALSFGPLSAMVREMRLARREKYRLLFKFVHRMALVGGVNVEGLPDRHTTTDLEFGAYLPNDEKAVVDMVTRLLEAKAVSLETAVSLLREAGVITRDQQDEVAAIHGADFEGAGLLLDATGNLGLVMSYLGREDEATLPPEPEVPPPPAAPVPPTPPPEPPA